MVEIDNAAAHSILEVNETKIMRAALAVFVKTPDLSPLKTRLAAGVGEAIALEFYHLSLKAVETAAQNADVKSYWAVAEEEGLNNPLWSAFETLHTGEGGLGERQHHIYETLLEKHARVILIGADAPQISPKIIEDAITALDAHEFVIGPAYDGGYYLFGGRADVSEHIWTSMRWSSDMTRSEFENALPSKAFQLTFLTDVDEEKDLQVMSNEMPENISQQQQNLIDWIRDKT